MNEVMRFELFWVLTAVGGGVVAALAAAYIPYDRIRIGAGLIAFFVLALLAPSVAQDRLYISDDGIEHITGIWFVPRSKGFRFVDVESIERFEVKTGRGKWRTEDRWRLHLASGDTEEFDPGTLWEMHLEEIEAVLKAKGITFR